LEDIGFQLKQQKALSPRCHLGTMPNLPISRLHFRAPTNTHAHPTTRFSNAVCLNMAAMLSDHTNKWKSVLYIDGYYVVGVPIDASHDHDRVYCSKRYLEHM
jgi:hypothetical protein